jgi:hypothetical protein
LLQLRLKGPPSTMRTFGFGGMLRRMDAQPPKPTRLTLVFFAAFAASFVQDRYTSPDIYRWLVGRMFQAALDLL